MSDSETQVMSAIGDEAIRAYNDDLLRGLYADMDEDLSVDPRAYSEIFS